MNASKRYLWGGGVVAVIVIGSIVGAIRPSKHAQAAPTIVPDIEVVRVQQQDVSIVHEWIGMFDGFVNADVRAQVTGYLLKLQLQKSALAKCTKTATVRNSYNRSSIPNPYPYCQVSMSSRQFQLRNGPRNPSLVLCNCRTDSTRPQLPAPASFDRP